MLQVRGPWQHPVSNPRELLGSDPCFLETQISCWKLLKEEETSPVESPGHSPTRTQLPGGNTVSRVQGLYHQALVGQSSWKPHSASRGQLRPSPVRATLAWAETTLQTQLPDMCADLLVQPPFLVVQLAFTLNWKSANFFYKGPDGKYFLFWAIQSLYLPVLWGCSMKAARDSLQMNMTVFQ